MRYIDTPVMNIQLKIGDFINKIVCRKPNNVENKITLIVTPDEAMCFIIALFHNKLELKNEFNNIEFKKIIFDTIGYFVYYGHFIENDYMETYITEDTQHTIKLYGSSRLTMIIEHPTNGRYLILHKRDNSSFKIEIDEKQWIGEDILYEYMNKLHQHEYNEHVNRLM